MKLTMFFTRAVWCALSVMPVWCVAQEVAMPLSLSEFVIEVVDKHPRVREQLHVFRQTQQDEAIAKSNWRPSVDLDASLMRVEGDNDTVSGFTSSDESYTSDRIELSVTQNLFNGFDTRYFNRQAKARKKAALYELLDVSDNVALDAVQAYLDALKQKRLLMLAEDNVNSHVDTLAKIKRRSNSGAGRRSQLEQTEGRVARAKASLIAQQNNLQDSLTALHELLGRYVYAEDLKEVVAPENVWVSASVSDLIDQALNSHPALTVAYANIEAAEYKQQRAHSTRYPKVDLRLAKEMGSDINGIPGDTDETSIALNLTYNFYRGGADKAERQKRISEVHEQQQFAAKVRRQVINTLRLAWDADQSIAEQLIFLKEHVIKSKETMNSYQEEFFIGQRDLIDLLDSKNEVNAAQNRYTESYYDGIAARFRVYEGVGDMFSSVELEIEMTDNDMVISRVVANKLDSLPLDYDLDKDGRLDIRDHCDNSLNELKVNENGCGREVAPKPMVKRDNKPPVAADDNWTLPQNGMMVISRAMLLNNDYDPDGDMIAIESFTAPVNGYLASALDGEWVYRAEEGFSGTDSFTYVINDGQVSTEANVVINVFAENDDEVDVAETHYVNFEFGKTELTQQSRVKVQKIVSKLLESPNLTINLSTHTDNVGTDAFNQRLSERRAKAVRAILSACGIENHRITAVGRGESDPVAENTTEVGRSINRRGEFRFERHAAYN